MKNYEVALLIGAGIGVTPAASLLKSVWYEYFRKSDIPLKKLYFLWLTRDPETISWFQSLLVSLEETVPREMLEIHTYVSGKMSLADVYNICINDSGEVDPVTELSSRCHYGRPDWTRVLTSIRSKCVCRPNEDKLQIGVFFCGPTPIAKALAKECIAASDDQVEFELRKEHF